MNLNRIPIIRYVEKGKSRGFDIGFRIVILIFLLLLSLCSLARLPIGRGVRARRYKLTTTSMTTPASAASSSGHGQPQCSPTEINNNSSALNVENNNDRDSFSCASDEENTSEYGQSPPVELSSAMPKYPSSDQQLTNRLNNNTDQIPSSLVSSTESDNILNNNNTDAPDATRSDDDTSGAYYMADSTGSLQIQRDDNDNQVQQVHVQ